MLPKESEKKTKSEHGGKAVSYFTMDKLHKALPASDDTKIPLPAYSKSDGTKTALSSNDPSADVVGAAEAHDVLNMQNHIISSNDAAEITEEGVISSIIQVAFAHKEDEGIQLECINSLWACSAKGPSIKREIALFGGVDIIIDAMKRHSASAELLEKGCFCLWSLAHDSETSVLIGQSSNVIIDAMTAHVDSVELQLGALGALKILAMIVDNNSSLQDDATVQTILLAMRTHNSSEKVCGSDGVDKHRSQPSYQICDGNET